MLGLPSFRAQTQKSQTEQERCIQFIKLLEENKLRIEKYQETPAKSGTFIMGLATQCGIELTKKQLIDAHQLNLKIEDLLKTNLPPINPLYSVPLRMALSYLFAYVMPTSVVSAAAMNLIVKDVVGAIFGKNHKEMQNIASITVLLINLFAEHSPSTLLRDALPELEESYGAGAYLFAPAFTLGYQLGRPYLVGGIKKSCTLLRTFFETASEFSDVIHGQGSYYEEQDNLASSSYRM